ncbi:FHA domain-containing protein, partial [Oscillochloris sp. ZM17-4]|uniref:FHA domain-containing protein n=1 Tax=Oscillochloris sp. ZM17-4 TaxID=2866714 RepID=UPI001C734539
GGGGTPPPASRPLPPGRGEDAETERGARRRRDAAQPAYRLVAWAGERRITHELRERQCVIGRDPGCDLQIDGPSVSNLHARLTLAGGQITLADLGSAGGTSLGPGGPRLPAHRPTELQDGDEFWIGPEVRVALRRADAW